MQKRFVPSRKRKHLHDACEACCGALRALELAWRIPEEDAGPNDHVTRAIELLRETLGELRLVEVGSEARVREFVLPTNPGPDKSE